MRAALLALVALASGCLAPDAVVPAAEDPPVAAAEDPWAGRERVTVLAVGGDAPSAAVEADVLCNTGGGPELRRDGPLILPGADRLEVRVRPAPAATAMEVGYAIDDGPVTWLTGAVGPVETTHVVPVAPQDAEGADMPRWRFFEQMNLPGPARQDCYTGASAGGWSVVVEAVRG